MDPAFQLRLINGELDRIETAFAQVDAQIDAVTEKVDAKLNKILWAIMGLTFTVAGGIIMAAINLGIGPR